MFEPIVILCTVPSQEEAEIISRTLVTERLAACVNIADDVKSIYIWKDKLCDESERLLMIKADKSMFVQLSNRIKELHSYEVPEIIGLPIVAGNEDYLNWLEKSVNT